MAQATRKSRYALAAVNGFGLEALAEENAQLAINPKQRDGGADYDFGFARRFSALLIRSDFNQRLFQLITISSNDYG